MADSRSSSQVKLDLARRHLALLQSDVQKFERLKGNRIEFDALPGESNRYAARLKLRTPAPLNRWGGMLGDCVHNARSALDHAIWALTEQDIDTPDTVTQFPVCLARTSATAELKRRTAKVDAVKFRRQLAAIRWVQPFRRADPNRSALAVLHALDIADKHKVLGLALVYPAELAVKVTAGQFTTVHQPAVSVPAVPPSWVNGATVAWFQCADVTVAQGPVEFSLEAATQVSVLFGQGVPRQYRGWPLFSSLDAILDRVQTVVRLTAR